MIEQEQQAGVQSTQHAEVEPAALRAGVRYPNLYLWYVLLSVLDILITYLILHPVFSLSGNLELIGQGEDRGQEVNVLADHVLTHFGIPGIVAYKLGLVLLVVCICEIVGARRPRLGRALAQCAVAISIIPVALGLFQMGHDIWNWYLPGPDKP